MHPVLGLLRYILYNLILNRIISGRWGPASATLLLTPQNVNFMPANFVASLPILENDNCVTSQCPEIYAEDALMLSQVIYLGLLWLGLIVLLNPGVTIGNFTNKYLKPRWWLIINSMWIWVVIPHHLETASYYPVISVTVLACKYLSPTNLKRIPTHNQLVNFLSDRRQASNPLAKSATTIKELVLTNALKKTKDGEMFLLHDNGQEVEDRIISYATTQDLEQLCGAECYSLVVPYLERLLIWTNIRGTAALFCYYYWKANLRT
ncbi:hypothetical protein DSO57_1008229 [Entomophthora muscae]|uniref:Uncharacterized protein n=1 Tax=Entomophthora muscae TaxID=34485 RepID=A0ACC2SWA2_9FUNG|nr:hypothetical protein DSO57_1008229 [Entomophthora muscae]